MAVATGRMNAQVKTIIGYVSESGDMHFFEGAVKGVIVAPRGEQGFGWDKIFQPSGHDFTFAEMTGEQKNTVSMRKIALEKLAQFIQG